MESPPIIMGSPPDSLSPPMTGKNKISPPNIFGSKTCKSPHGDGGGDETMYIIDFSGVCICLTEHNEET